MDTAFFYLFAFFTLLCGLLVIANPFTRNPVTSAMFLVLTIVSLAGLFVQLHAFFLAAVQVLVYAGAVMGLFVFVIMLLDLKEEERRKIKGAIAGLAVIASGVIAWVMIRAIKQNSFGLGQPKLEGSAILIGQKLFTQFAVPFEVMSLLLLAAMIGAVLLSKKGSEMSPIDLQHYLVVSVLLFCIGLLGVIVRRNILVIYMSLELMLNAANLALVAFSRYNNNLDGQVIVVFVITVAAAEVALGLALIVALYRRRQTTHVEDLASMKL